MSASNEKKINKSASRQIHAVNDALKARLINPSEAKAVRFFIANGKVYGRKRPHMTISDYLRALLQRVAKMDVEVHVVILILEYTGENPVYYINLLPFIPRDDECKECGRTMLMAMNVHWMGNEDYVCRVCKKYGKPTPCRYCTRRQIGVVGYCCDEAYDSYQGSMLGQARHNEMMSHY